MLRLAPQHTFWGSLHLLFTPLIYWSYRPGEVDSSLAFYECNRSSLLWESTPAYRSRIRTHVGRNHRYGPGLVYIPHPPVSHQQTHLSSLSRPSSVWVYGFTILSYLVRISHRSVQDVVLQEQAHRRHFLLPLPPVVCLVVVTVSRMSVSLIYSS